MDTFRVLLVMGVDPWGEGADTPGARLLENDVLLSATTLSSGVCAPFRKTDDWGRAVALRTVGDGAQFRCFPFGLVHACEEMANGAVEEKSDDSGALHCVMRSRSWCDVGLARMQFGDAWLDEDDSVQIQALKGLGYEPASAPRAVQRMFCEDYNNRCFDASLPSWCYWPVPHHVNVFVSDGWVVAPRFVGYLGLDGPDALGSPDLFAGLPTRERLTYVAGHTDQAVACNGQPIELGQWLAGVLGSNSLSNFRDAGYSFWIKAQENKADGVFLQLRVPTQVDVAVSSSKPITVSLVVQGFNEIVVTASEPDGSEHKTSLGSRAVADDTWTQFMVLFGRPVASDSDRWGVYYG